MFIVGCGSSGVELVPVTGKVTFNQKPLVGADVEFSPEDAYRSPSYGRTNERGEFELGYTNRRKGALLGTHIVRIVSETEGMGAGNEAVLMQQYIPAKYNEQSELRAEVKPDQENHFEFDLQGEMK